MSSKKQKKKTAGERFDNMLYEMASALHSIGKMDSLTLREYKKLKTPKVKSFKAKQIQHIRLDNKVSQSVFAKLLNISPETVRKWEQGDRHPTGASLKLLNLVSTHGLQALY